MEVQSNFFIYGKPTILAHLTSSFSNVQTLPWVHPRKIILFNSIVVGGFSNSLIFHCFPIKVVLSNLCFINSIVRGNSMVLLMNLYSFASLINPILIHQVLFSIPFTPNKPYFSKLMCYILPFVSQKSHLFFKKNSNKYVFYPSFSFFHFFHFFLVILFNYAIFLPRRICFIPPFFLAFFSFWICFPMIIIFLFFLLGGCGHLGDFLLLKIYHFAK